MHPAVLMAGGEVYLGLVWFSTSCYSSVRFYTCSFLYTISCTRVKIAGRNVILNSWILVCASAEAAKNKLAETTMHRLMKHAVWINIHLAPIPVLEIRVADGYGARWLADGSKVTFSHSLFERTQLFDT